MWVQRNQQPFLWAYEYMIFYFLHSVIVYNIKNRYDPELVTSFRSEEFPAFSSLRILETDPRDAILLTVHGNEEFNVSCASFAEAISVN